MDVFRIYMSCGFVFESASIAPSRGRGRGAHKAFWSEGWRCLGLQEGRLQVASGINCLLYYVADCGRRRDWGAGMGSSASVSWR